MTDHHLATRLATAAFIAALTWALTACGGVNCFDDGPLQESYDDGVIAADEQNRIAYQTGLDEGLSLTRTDGEIDGLAEGYDLGFGDGYNSIFGYPSGYDDGFAVGYGDGYSDPSACDAGAYDGGYDGESYGYSDGWDASYGDGYDTGYGDGYYAGQLSCSPGLGVDRPDPDEHRAAVTDADPAHAEEVDPDDLAVCYDRGYRSSYDITAYPRGLAQGKSENPEYQAGYSSTFPGAYQDGVIDGESAGYADGYDIGYGDGYATGYDEVYYACYDPAYQDGYASGYDVGYEDGYYAGYDDGYAVGYDDGANDC